MITGLFRRKRQGFGGSLKPSDLKMEKIEEKKKFLQNRPAITALRVVFHFDHFLCVVYAIPIPGHPCIPICLSSCPFVSAASICYSQQVRILWYVFFLLVSFAPYPISELFGFYSSSFCFCRSSYFGWRFFCCALVPGTLALDLHTWIL